MANGEGEGSPEGQASPPEGNREDASPEGSQDPTPGQEPQDGHQAQGQGGAPATDPSTGGQTGFTHPRLQGRSPEEIEQLVTQMERTVQEQGQTLTQLQQQRQQAQQDGQQPSEPEISDEEFFDKPTEAVRSIVGEQLRETVQPLAEQLGQLSRRDQAQSMEAQYRDAYPNWDENRRYMEMLAERKGLDFQQQVLPDEGVVEVLYYAVEGLKQGQQGQPGPQGQPSQAQQPQQGQQVRQQQQSPQQQQPSNQQGRQPAPPQHSPSASPMPGSAQQGQSQGQQRQLTEQEKRLAREYGMSEQEFIEWQEMDAREAVTGPRPDQEG